MKSRSHRLPTSVPTTDDWVDGSWTVDCVCGVNFDDGEEMVNCDECGVWVHTRCSRYVKSEKSFACDKCKSKNSRNESEETEVAQLLVELPTKTLRMDNPSQVSGHPRRPFRLWTDMPMEERVHVQGIPGGEPALFGGLSTVFTPELWKCTGYVPKKFNFQYREFPCWDEEHEVNGKIEEDGENPVDKGAGVLFSLSKENVLATPVATLMGMKSQANEYGRDRSAPSKDIKKWGGENIGSRCPQNGIKKDRTLLRPSVIHSNKRQKDDSGTSKDRSGKKKAKVADRDGDPKKRAPQASKTASTLSGAKELEIHKGVGSKIVKINAQKSIKNADLRDTLPTIDPLPGGHDLVESNLGKPELNFASGECHPAEARASDASRNKFSGITRPMEGKAGHQVSPMSQSSLITDDCLTALLEHKEPGSVPAKEQVAGIPENVNKNGGSSSVTSRIDPLKSEPLVDNFGTVVAEGKDNRKCREPSVDLCPRSIESGAKVKTEAELHSSEGTFCFESRTPSVLKLDGTKPLAQQSGASADQLYENDKTDGSAVTSLHSSDVKLRGIDRAAEAASICRTDGEFPSDHRQPKRQGEGSKRSIAVGKSSSELKHDSAFDEEPTNISCTSVIPPAPPCQLKVAVSSSASSTTVISKPPISDNFRPLNAQNQNPTAKQGVSDCSITVKKDEDSTSGVFNEEKHEVPRKILKERPKSSFNSTPKATHSSKISPTSDSKKTLSESKDPVPYTSSTQFLGVSSGSGEHSSLLQFSNAPNAQNKISASDIQPRGEKINQSNSQSSSRVTHTTLMHHPAPSKSPSTLSDEELALLLHHELNSSPRVPRVPRMRHTGSLPQLGSPTAAASMLTKRTSSSGGRDHSVVAKRKNKDLPKDKSRSTHDIDDEAKMDRLLPPSPDPGRPDSACATGAFSKRGGDSGSGKGVHAIKKIAPSVSTTSVSTGPSSSNEANEQNLSYMQNSPRNASDDDTGTIGVPSHQTLPGLIAEIMSTGKRVSYEELCNAVLPHWPNLRKHNGERYAYSSHSQAVLDCLRNRHEWAQLVDRGPKTNAGRKRRKLDAEAPSFESEDTEYGQDTTVKAVENKSFESHRDEFPKGKRKARKRRRLSLQGRGIKDVRRQRLKADELSDDDDAGSFSSSSEEDSMFSDDEIQGGRTCPVGSEGSTSSDEMGTES